MTEQIRFVRSFEQVLTVTPMFATPVAAVGEPKISRFLKYGVDLLREFLVLASFEADLSINRPIHDLLNYSTRQTYYAVRDRTV